MRRSPPAQPGTLTHRGGQAGFTLVELMIVVAIVAILAAVAIPSYVGYSRRAKVSEVMLALSGCRTVIADVYLAGTSTPGANAWGCESSSARSRYVGAITTDDDGVVTVVTEGFNDPTIDGKTIVMRPYKSDSTPMQASDAGSPIYKWVCGPAASGGVPRDYLPASCRS